MAPGLPAALHTRACLVPACRYGRHRSRLCHRHHTDWTTAGTAGSADAWAAAVETEPDDHHVCGVPGCDLWASFSDGFCVSHQGRFNAFRRRTGTDDSEAFVAAVALAGLPRVNLAGLAPQLKLEVQYVVQCFLDNGPRRVNLSRWNAVVRTLNAYNASSLLDRTAAEWIATLQLRKGNPDGALFISWGRDQVDRLVHGTGWDREYPLDTWTLNRVGHAATGVARISFTPIAQPWLRELVKQWTRHRLSIGIASPGVRTAVGVLAALLPATPFAPLTTVPGWGTVRAGNYGAAVGDPTRWPGAAQLYRASGLSPAQYESAGRRRDGTISREGSVQLRRALIDLGLGLWLTDPAAKRYGQQLQARGKHGGVIGCAMAHRANQIAYALVRDQAGYDPARWT